MEFGFAARTAVDSRRAPVAPTRRRARRITASIFAAGFAAALSLAAPADAAGLGPSAGEMQRFASQLNLSGSQRAQVNAITQALVRENNAILQRHGLRVGTCTDLGPLKLAAVNNEVNTAFSRARGQLSSILTNAQLSQFSSIYQARRQAAQRTIVCNSRNS